MALPGSNRQREIILLPVQVRLVDFDLYHQSFHRRLCGIGVPIVLSSAVSQVD
jgi:hypothetical protein